MYKRTCPNCNKEFNTSDYRQKYCNPKCYHESQREIDRTKVKELFDQGKLASEIADILGCTANGIRRVFEAMGIESKGRSYALHKSRGNFKEFSKEELAALDGHLLGDGCLARSNGFSSKFSSSLKYQEHCQYMMDGVGFEGRFNYDKKQSLHIITSLAYANLLPQRERWYPEGNKIVPKDIKLTPDLVRRWFIDDGCHSIRKRASNSLMFCTCNFTIEDVNFLSEMLKELGFKANTRIETGYPVIRFSTKSISDFFDYIGPPPIECYSYKWPK
ncbi:MAG: hypothetical protein WC476_01125 [Phycisphaerae bacterium]|jgi:hypothetical protein